MTDKESALEGLDGRRWTARTMRLGNRLVVRLEDADGHTASLEVAITDVLDWQLPERAKATSRGLVKEGESGYGRTLSERDVIMLALPKFHSLEWMEQMLREHQTFTAMSKATGYPENTLSAAARLHGFEPRKRRIDDHTKRQIRADREGGMDLKVIAKKYDVSLGSVHSIVTAKPTTIGRAKNAKNNLGR
jgi:hypothetical protein